MAHDLERRPVPESVRAAFVTDYARLDAFRRALCNLIDRKTDAAILESH